MASENMKLNNEFNIDLKVMRSYLEVITRQSFTGASKFLRVGQATISHQIQMIEDSLGVTLLIRNSRQISVTDEGKLFQAFCENVLAESEKLVASLDSFSSSATCVIAASTIPSVYILPELIASAMKVTAGCFYKTWTGDTRDCIELIKEGGADAGIVGKEIKHPHLTYTKIFSDEVILAGNTDMPSKIRADELQSLPLIFRENGSGTRDAFDTSLAAAGIQISSLSRVFQCSNSEAVKRSVISGIGAGYISELAVKSELKTGEMKKISIQGMKIARDFFLVRHKKRPGSKALDAFVTAVKNRYRV